MTRNSSLDGKAYKARHLPVDALEDQTIQRLLSRLDAELARPDFAHRQSVWSYLRLATAVSRSRRFAFRSRAPGPWLRRLARLSA